MPTGANILASFAIPARKTPSGHSATAFAVSPLN